MSLSVSVKFSKPMPSPEAWQEAIAKDQFPVSLDLDFDPKSFSGYLPVEYEGKPSGFEYFFEEISDHEREVTLLTHARAIETASAIFAAASLCRVTAGILSDYSGSELSSRECLNWARAEVASMESLITAEGETPDDRGGPPDKPWWKFW